VNGPVIELWVTDFVREFWATDFAMKFWEMDFATVVWVKDHEPIPEENTEQPFWHLLAFAGLGKQIDSSGVTGRVEMGTCKGMPTLILKRIWQ
jgi:hypothetical protein